MFIRFPKTNIVYEWKDIVYTNDVAAFSKHIEEIILQHPEKFYDNNSANGDELYEMTKERLILIQNLQMDHLHYLHSNFLIMKDSIITMINTGWVFIRRDELFSIKFLKEVCQLMSANQNWAVVFYSMENNNHKRH